MAHPQQLSADQLRTVLTQTLSSNAEIRKAAEQHLSEAQKHPGHPLEVLKLVASSDLADASVRQAAAVHFKNIVKKGWDVDQEGGTSGIVISPEDRGKIKTHLVELMCTVPPQIQAQCSESISLIAAVDFPSEWQGLLPDLVRKFDSPVPAVVQGVLLTANSILKRFRWVNRSDALYRDLSYCLQQLQAPLLTLFKTTGKAVDAYANDAVNLQARFACLRPMCRIWYSLNYQDLPEYFEDHMGEWMEEFAKYLQYENPLLVDPTEEDEPSLIDKLQDAIVANLNLYSDKDEEPFMPFLQQFVGLVWNLLMKMTALPKHDALTTTSIRFLSSLVAKLMHRHLFEQEGALEQIVGQIVIPNLMIREVDEERFEEDPQEFIRGDMEGNDEESRRKCSQAMLRSMCRQFENETTAICSTHISTMLGEFAKDPSNQWKAKDAAIHLMFGISIRAESTIGISELNPSVNAMEFFSAHILPELQDSNHARRPMVKATCLKFVNRFRNQFSKQDLVGMVPLIMAHLSSPHVVVHTYAAAAIEKFLTTKEVGANGVKQPKFGNAELRPFLEPLFTRLFAVVDNVELNENEYIMKCVMRTLSVAKADTINVTHIVLEKLTSALGRVAKNPRNPQFNHYLFESVAVLIRSVCSVDPAHTASFEALLFPPFQTVLQMDVVEFTPYVFQLLAQLLEYRPKGSGLGDAYTGLFAPLLTPALWERKGNIPALTRLLQAYLENSAAELVSGGYLMGILGVFQKLISSKANETSAINLLCSLIQNVPLDNLQNNLKDLFQILLMKLQQAKTPRYIRLLTHFLALFVGKFGAQAYFDHFNAIQSGLGLMLLSQVWISRLASDLPVRMEAKVQVIGLTKLLCDTPALLSDTHGQEVWGQALAGIMMILSSPGSNIGVLSGIEDEDTEVEIEYDATFSRLHFAAQTPKDPFPEVQDAAVAFVMALHSLSASHPGKLQPILQKSIHPDPKFASTLDALCQKAGVSLV